MIIEYFKGYINCNNFNDIKEILNEKMKMGLMSL